MTKRFLFSFLVLCFAISVASAKFASTTNGSNADSLKISASAVAAVDLNGKWNLTVSLPDQAISVTLDLTQTDQTFAGTMSSALGEGKVANGTIKENDFNAVVQANIQGQDMEIQMSGKYEDDKINGTLSIPNAEAFTFTGTRVKQQ